ncbi:MAG: Asp-tRNA(Asn)/Glu-tRNA(Gln) amidotransferase subunit GatB [Planctomycetes bacterium]|nr:Asp-tRNA(Asn)/Glu-tRNA(Gln) amidotransferase subunit GatB [Planctomycetota bacterium]
MTATKIEYEPVIGLEVHVQMKTLTKMFCACEVKFGAPANSLTCPVCLGLPGALPMVNKQAVEYGIRVGLALNCQIAHHIKFDRKNYFYPDLPKGYQISQFDEPLCFDGELQLPINDSTGQPKICRIERAHLEEDAGKSIHMDGCTLVDLNRAGTALIEVVGGPDLRSPEEAYVYLNTLKRNLSYLGISDLSMEKGSLRCDANISVRPKGQEKFGVRSEVKNLNSFRAVRAALESEIKRHIAACEAGETLHMDTRQWDEETGTTKLMRSKEAANDYRFFPEPDLGLFDVSRDWVDRVRGELPEMPEKRLLRFLHDFKLSQNDAEWIAGDMEAADYFEQALKLKDDPKKVAVWLLSGFSREMAERKVGIGEIPVSPANLIELIDLLDAGKLNNITAKEVFAEMASTGEKAEDTARKLDKLITQDDSAVDAAIDEVIAEFEDGAVADVKAGEKKAVGFLVGQCMRKLGGKANPKELGQKILKKILG